MNKLPNLQLELIKKSFGIVDWDSLLSASDRHIVILSKAIPPMLKESSWYEGGKPDWILVKNLLSSSMQGVWPNSTKFEIEISERLNQFIDDYLGLGGWSIQHEFWLSRYEKLINAVYSNRLALDESTYMFDMDFG
jgi:hypothetical protein